LIENKNSSIITSVQFEKEMLIELVALSFFVDRIEEKTMLGPFFSKKKCAMSLTMGITRNHHPLPFLFLLDTISIRQENLFCFMSFILIS